MPRSYLTGCQAVAEGARLAAVQVVAAYPITPQTAIVETLASAVARGELDAQMVPVESEHSAMSVCIGAAMVGARAFTASSSQGLILMHECLFMASGLRLPIVMAVANRALASPVTIFADHQDSLATRDACWLQLYAETCQEVLDYILIAYRTAYHPEVMLPVMVCLDGFFLSHISEPVSVPDQAAARDYLADARPAYPMLDVDDPRCFNVMAFPDYFSEFQRDRFESMRKAALVLDAAFQEFEASFGRSHARVEGYRTSDAQFILVGMGSLMGTVKQVVDDHRREGHLVGAVRITAFRPFPESEVAGLCRNATAVGVLDRDVSPGSGGILFAEVSKCLYGSAPGPRLVSFVLGLGGRDVTEETVTRCLEQLLTPAAQVLGGAVHWPDANTATLRKWGLGDADGDKS
ncbi:MAG: pyruvate ferredoxin oxidoreductase [Bacillota bacterium]